jgi:endonuclease IV
MTVLELLEAQKVTVHSGAYLARTSAQTEIRRLHSIIERAKNEADPIQHNGAQALAVPAWFLNA